MNITFTPEELKEYASRLDKWYGERAVFVLENMSNDCFARIGDRVSELIKTFEAKNQRPDWRNLL